MISDQERMSRAIAMFDAANAEDPNKETVGGKEFPKELLYSMRMSAMLERYAPDASEVVKLAVRAQHIQRWKIPRADFPKTLFGYKQWRSGLYKFHGDIAGRLMQEAGYDKDMTNRVKAIIGKLGIKVNPETQIMEDVANMVFIENYLVGFAAQHPEYDEAKWIDILQKTWRKMSPNGHVFALSKIKLPESMTPLIIKAVGK